MVFNNHDLGADNIASLAERLRLTPRKVRELISSGDLRAIKIGRDIRIPHSATRDFLSRQLEVA